MAHEPLGRLLDMPSAELRDETAHDIEVRILRAYARNGRGGRSVLWSVLAGVAVLIIGGLVLATRDRPTPSNRSTGVTAATTAATLPSTSSAVASLASQGDLPKPPATYFGVDQAAMSATEWTVDGQPIRTFGLEAIPVRPHALPDGSAVGLGDDLSGPNQRFALKPTCTNLPLQRLEPAGTRTPLHPELGEARLVRVSPTGVVMAIRARCPADATYGDADTGWELVAYRIGGDTPPTVVAGEPASLWSGNRDGENPSAPQSSNMPDELRMSADGSWVSVLTNVGLPQWRVYRAGSSVTPLDLDDCDVTTLAPTFIDAERVAVICTETWPSTRDRIEVRSLDDVLSSTPVDPRPLSFMTLSARPGAPPDEMPEMLASWAQVAGGPVTVASITPEDIEVLRTNGAPTAAVWTLAELGLQEVPVAPVPATTLADDGEAPTTVAAEPLTARYCVTTPTSLVEELRSPWVVLKDLKATSCNVYAADAGTPVQAINLLGGGDRFTRVIVGDVVGWVQSSTLQALRLPSTTGSPAVCRLKDIASIDPGYSAPAWGINACVDGWAILRRDPSVPADTTTTTTVHIVQWADGAWHTRIEVVNPEAEICGRTDLDDLPSGLARNLCSVRFDVTSAQLGDLRFRTTTADDAVRMFRIVFGAPTADSGDVNYRTDPVVALDPDLGCRAGGTVRVLQWGDLQLGFGGDGTLFTWSLGVRAPADLAAIVPPGDPTKTPFLNGTPQIGSTSDTFLTSLDDSARNRVADLPISDDGTTMDLVTNTEGDTWRLTFSLFGNAISGITANGIDGAC